MTELITSASLISSGLNLVQALELLRDQDGSCAICQKAKEGLIVDVNPQGQVCGLLCTNCKQGIELLNRDPKLAQAMYDYRTLVR